MVDTDRMRREADGLQRKADEEENPMESMFLEELASEHRAAADLIERQRTAIRVLASLDIDATLMYDSAPLTKDASKLADAWSEAIKAASAAKGGP